tara:strand:+ start:167 stop:400 length:234 start_codon:yes stop_codon:yes gene_type:complete
MKNSFFLIVGIFCGLWLSWPGIIAYKNWVCIFKIIEASKKEKISFKAFLATSPNYFLKAENKNNLSKFRIVSDACFR